MTKTHKPEALEELKEEAREISSKFAHAANAGDGENIIALRARAADLRVLIDAAEIKALDARLPALEAAASVVETPEDRAALEAEYEATKQAASDAQKKLDELHIRNENRRAARRAALTELRAAQTLRAEIVARNASPTMAARHLATA